MERPEERKEDETKNLHRYNQPNCKDGDNHPHYRRREVHLLVTVRYGLEVLARQKPDMSVHIGQAGCWKDWHRNVV